MYVCTVCMYVCMYVYMASLKLFTSRTEGSLETLKKNFLTGVLLCVSIKSKHKEIAKMYVCLNVQVPTSICVTFLSATHFANFHYPTIAK